MLTPAQQQTLKAFIVANATMAAFPKTGDGAYAVAGLLNAQASPAFTVYRSSIAPEEWGIVIQAGDLDSITTGNSTRLGTFRSVVGSLIPSRLDHRTFMNGIFSGAAGTATSAAMLAAWKRTATVLEKVFATGTGTDGSPATLGKGDAGRIEGPISYSEVEAVRNLP